MKLKPFDFDYHLTVAIKLIRPCFEIFLLRKKHLQYKYVVPFVSLNKLLQKSLQ